ncbi:hypothetical protein JOB18_018870 [Solea senegalensis]|uniref:Uncharacterized protein n=1 Tax=Solea senegalensis TaxID=28829 RepID=A0AAV6RCX7_SOLSE|nr:hypothetical protein JOB18_018870 [Solea senegalensis]
MGILVVAVKFVTPSASPSCFPSSQHGFATPQRPAASDVNIAGFERFRPFGHKSASPTFRLPPPPPPPPPQSQRASSVGM